MNQERRNLLVVLAHPDDETILGGTLARYSHEDVRITLVCTTNGGGGLAPPDLSPVELARIRQSELREACAILGVERLEFFEDREARSDHLTRHNYHEIINQHREWVSQLLEKVRPDIVVTFGPDGVTGHETHIMVGKLTTDAVLASATQPGLFHFAFSHAQVQRMASWFEQNPEILRAYANEVVANPRLGAQRPVLYHVEDEKISVRIKIIDFLDRKRQAFRCHRTQGGGGSILEVFGIESYECFVRVGSDTDIAECEDLFEQAQPRSPNDRQP